MSNIGLSEYQKELFPKYSKEIDTINNLITQLNNRRSKTVNPATIPITPKVVFNLKSYVQLSLHRVVDLAMEACNSWNNGTPVVAIILDRAMLENVAYLFDISNQIKRYITENQFSEIHNLISNRLVGSRLKEARSKICNVMTVIDKIDKTFRGFKENYNFLSDFCHPNYSGMLGLYGKMNYDEIYLKIDRRIGISEEIFFNVLFSLEPSLLIFEDCLNDIEKIYPALTDLSNKDAEQKYSNLK